MVVYTLYISFQSQLVVKQIRNMKKIERACLQVVKTKFILLCEIWHILSLKRSFKSERKMLLSSCPSSYKDFDKISVKVGCFPMTYIYQMGFYKYQSPLKWMFSAFGMSSSHGSLLVPWGPCSA